MGGWWKPLEEKLSSIPLLGDAIKGAQGSALDDFNRAIYNRTLAPLGQTYSGPVGQPALASLDKTFSKAYDDALANMGPSPLTNDFVTGVDKVRSMIASRPQAAQAFDDLLKGELWNRFTPANTLTPSALKDADSALGAAARNWFAKGNADQIDAARSVSQVQRGLRQMAAQANPTQAPVLRAVDNGYAQLVQLQNAAKSASVAGRDGVVTPYNYLNGIRQGDTSVRDHVFSSGQMMNQDLAQNANTTLANKYPDSGSIGRGLIAAVAAHEFAPPLLAGTAAAAIPYLPIGRQLFSLLPKGATAAGKLAPYAGLSAPMIAGLLAQ
jgi:hypothetical protein